MFVRMRLASLMAPLLLGVGAWPAAARDIVPLMTAEDLPSGRGPLSCDMAVAESGDIVLRLAGNLYDPFRKEWLLDRNRADRPTLRATPGRADIMLVSELSAVSLTPDNVLLAIDGRQMGFVSRGDIDLRLALPNTGMKLATGPGNQIYFFGGDGADAAQFQSLLDELAETEARLGSQSIEAVRLRGKIETLPRSYLVYRFSRSDGLVLAFEALDKVSDLIVVDDGAIFATGTGIYIYDVAGGIRPILAFADGENIGSLAYDAAADNLYFLKGRDLYGLADGVVTLIAAEAADKIAYRRGRLYLCDAARSRIGYIEY